MISLLFGEFFWNRPLWGKCPLLGIDCGVGAYCFQRLYYIMSGRTLPPFRRRFAPLSILFSLIWFSFVALVRRVESFRLEGEKGMAVAGALGSSSSVARFPDDSSWHGILRRPDGYLPILYGALLLLFVGFVMAALLRKKSIGQ